MSIISIQKYNFPAAMQLAKFKKIRMSDFVWHEEKTSTVENLPSNNPIDCFVCSEDFLKYKGHSGIQLMLSEHFSLKQRRSIYLLHDFAKNKGLKHDQEAVFDLKTLEEEFEGSVKFAFSKEAIEKAGRIGLVNIVEESNNFLLRY